MKTTNNLFLQFGVLDLIIQNLSNDANHAESEEEFYSLQDEIDILQKKQNAIFKELKEAFSFAEVYLITDVVMSAFVDNIGETK